MAIHEQLVTGPAIADCLEGLASLRLDIFREFPYLYDGRREDELRYLQLYADAPEALVMTVTDSGTMIGAATGIPLCHEHRELLDPFASTPYPVEDLYYVGELLLYPAYRNRGMGLRLVALIEDQVRSLGIYRFLTCATVVRPDDHPLRPVSYVPIDRFLARTGFSPLPGITTSFTWRETDGVSRDHPMKFWLKKLW